MAGKKPERELTPAEEMAEIEQRLGYRTFEPPQKYWLNTGARRLNNVLGSEELGVAYGKMIEVFGPNSHGKTMLTLFLLALAQEDGAHCLWIDLENSWDDQWVIAQGIDPSRVLVIKPKIAYFRDPKTKKMETKPRLETAEELCARGEAWMDLKYAQNPQCKMFVAIDSIAAILVEEEASAGLTGQNMRTRMSGLPMFMSHIMRRWVALAANYNAIMVWVNQIRNKPPKFGTFNTETTPGGNAAGFYCSIRVSVRRASGGRLIQGGKTIGLKGVIKNIKNKAGGGSLEGGTCGYETIFGKKKWRFPTAASLQKENQGSTE